MFSDHDNPVSAAAAAPAHDAQSEATPPKEPATQQENSAAQEDAPHEELKAEVSAEVPADVPAAPQPAAAEVHAKAE
ncbi:MAG: hypothetical protein DMG34_06895, partial [Acidobacteria bacterium]